MGCQRTLPLIEILEFVMDEAKLGALSKRIMGIYEGALVSGMVYLGDEMGLYRAMHEQGPITSDQVATRAGLHERFVREWLSLQAAAGLIEYQGDGLFYLSPEAGLLLAEEEDLRSMARWFDNFPQRTALLSEIPRSFKTGIGISWSDVERGGTSGRVQWMERLLRPWYEQVLVQTVLPELDGLIESLNAGSRVADVGCGSGVAVVTMASAFPKSEFYGWEIAPLALDRCRENAIQAGVTNAVFHDVRQQQLPEDGSFEFVTTFDCVHDMTSPDELATAIYNSMTPDGRWLIVDPTSKGTLEENIEMPLAVFGYAASVAGCLQSAMSEPNGAGHGVFGLPAPAMQELTEKAGFTRFRQLDITHAMNSYYEVRP
ncbi:MAG: hypothetical protein CL407_07135 [Acidimicrobiaceae bacterium]|nr:hypothetical protein [Acidimicrobiaceae bacterium]